MRTTLIVYKNIQLIQMINIITPQNMNNNQYNPLMWPPNMKLAELHHRCVRPGILDPQGKKCPCCNKQQKNKNKKWLQRNIINDFRYYGGGVPAYFKMLLYSIISFCILMVVKAYHVYLLQTVCPQLEETDDPCSVSWGIVKMCSTQILYKYLQSADRHTQALVINCLQITTFLVLVISIITIKIYLQSLKQHKIEIQQKLFSKFSLIFKSIPTYYQIGDIKKQIEKINSSIEIIQIFFVQSFGQFDRSYRNIFDLYFKIKNIQEVDGGREVLDGLYQKYVRLWGVVRDGGNFQKVSKKVIVVFNTAQAKKLVYDQFKINQCSKFCHYIGKLLGYSSKISYYAQKIAQPQEIHWNNIGQSSTFKTRVRLETGLIAIGFMILSFSALYFPLVMVNQVKTTFPRFEGTLIGIGISLFLLILSFCFRMIIVGLVPRRRASSRLSEAYFVIMTTIIFHFLFYAVTPASFFIFATSIPANTKLRQFFSAIATFVCFSLILAIVDIKYRNYNTKKKKLLSQTSQSRNFCQQRIHQQLTPPPFPIQFKVFFIFSLWTFNSYFIFEIPYIEVLFVILLSVVYWIDKRNLYKHNKMQSYLSLELEIKVQKLYIVFFLISVGTGYSLTAYHNWEIIFAGIVTIIALIINFTLNKSYKKQKQRQQDQTLRKTNIKHILQQFQNKQVMKNHLNVMENQLKMSFIGQNPPTFSQSSFNSNSFNFGYNEVYTRYKNQFKDEKINGMLKEKFLWIRQNIMKVSSRRKESQLPFLKQTSICEEKDKKEIKNYSQSIHFQNELQENLLEITQKNMKEVQLSYKNSHNKNDETIN